MQRFPLKRDRKADFEGNQKFIGKDVQVACAVMKPFSPLFCLYIGILHAYLLTGFGLQ